MAAELSVHADNMINTGVAKLTCATCFCESFLVQWRYACAAFKAQSAYRNLRSPTPAPAPRLAVVELPFVMHAREPAEVLVHIRASNHLPAARPS